MSAGEDARRSRALIDHRRRLLACTRCPDMIRPVIAGPPVVSAVMLIGQAPGPREGAIGRPFGWTAGRTLFEWFARIGLDEAAFRERVYIAAVCRCFPGKSRGGGDWVPSRTEIGRCRPWLEREWALLEPELLIPVGKLAISELMPLERLVDVVGRPHRVRAGARTADAIPLPHPSGASTWHRTEPGRTLLEDGLAAIATHPAWQRIL